jgi:hypothetical protein
MITNRKRLVFSLVAAGITALVVLIGVVPKAREARAWDGVISGRVGTIGISGTGESVYITIEGGGQFCSNASKTDVAWVLSPTHHADRRAAESLTALLVSAKLSGKTVTFYSNNNPGNWGCLMGFIEVP